MKAGFYCYCQSEAEYLFFGAFGTLTKNVKPTIFSNASTLINCGVAVALFATR